MPPPYLLFALATVATQAGHVLSALAGGATAARGAAYFAAYLVGAALAPALIDRLGMRRTWQLGLGVGALGAVALAVWPTGWPGLSARLAGGAGYGIVLVGVESWCLAMERPDRALARYLVVFYWAAALAQLAALAPKTAGAPVAALALVALWPAALGAAPPVEAAGRPRPSLLAAAPGGAIAVFTSGLVFGGLYASGPIFARATAPGPLAAAALMVAVILAGAVLQRPAVQLAARLGRGAVIGLASLGLIGAAAAASMAGVSYLAGVGGAAAVGALAALLYPMGLATLAERVAPASRPAASGTMLVVLAAGSSAGPGLASALDGPLAGSGVWALTVGVGLATAATALAGMAWRARRRAWR